MTAVIQPSFAAGELAPSLHARVDLAKYHVGAATLKNFFVYAHGGAANRPGTQFVDEVKDSAATYPPRLLPFQFSTTQTYILEFGHHYMRVIMDGGYVMDGSDPYEIATPYDGEDLRRLKYTQSADVMTITHPDYAPRDLSRLDHDDWSLDTITFIPDIATPGSPIAAATGSGATVYSYKVTAVSAETGEESLPTAEFTATNDEDLNSTTYNDLDWNAVAGAERYNVYKKRNGLYGYIGATEDLEFRDDNIEADVTLTPPGSRNPFAGGNYPAVVEYHEQRKVFGGSNEQPQTWWASQSASLNNMNVSNPAKDDDAITRTIGAKQVNEIRHFVSLKDLLILTSGAIFRVSPGQSDFITPSQAATKPQTYRGVSHVPPLLVDNSILHVQARGSIVRDLRYDFASDGYQAVNMSVLSNHLFRGHQILEWAFAEEPNSQILAVRDDGILLGFTYMKEQDVYAWYRYETDGVFESIASIVEGEEDAVYVVVRRTINATQKRYIERFSTRLFDDVSEAWFLDCALRYEGAPATVINGLDHLNGREVAILGDGNVMPSQTVSSGSITLQHECSTVLVGLAYEADLETLNIDLGQPTQQGKRKKITKVVLRLEETRGLSVGPDEDHLTEIKERSDEAYGEAIPVFTGDREIIIDPTWNTDGRIFVRQSYPLPATVLAVIPEVTTGG